MVSTAYATIADQSLQDVVLINFGICAVLGLSLNILVLCVLVGKLKKHGAHTDVKICTFVAITDIIASLGILFRSIFAKFPYNILKTHTSWCRFDALITQGINCSGYTLAVMSMERFLLICFNIQFSFWFWLIILFIIYALIFIISIVSLANGLEHLTSTQVTCTYHKIDIGYYGFIIATIFLLVSFVMVLFCYFGIIITKSKQCLNQINLNIPKETVYKELRSTLFKALINILLYILVFSAKLYGLLYALITGLLRPMLVETASQILISYSPAVNAIILLYMNQDIRVSFIAMLRRIKPVFSS